MGLDAGVLARLELIHLIPPERLTEDYLLRLCKSLAMSSLLLRLISGHPRATVALRTEVVEQFL